MDETSASLKDLGVRTQKTSELTWGTHELMNENIRNPGKSLKALVALHRNMAHIEADNDKIAQIIKAIDEKLLSDESIGPERGGRGRQSRRSRGGFCSSVVTKLRNKLWIHR